MKAITITTELKLANPDIFGSATIGSIREFSSVPKSFSSLDYNPEQRTDGYHTLDNSVHEADGFFDVVKPAIDEATQKLGALYFDSTSFTYPIIALTQPEIDAKVEAEADNVASETEGTRREDGEAEAIYIFKHLRKLKNNGTLTNNQFDAAQDLVFDALLPMTYGLWDVTKTRLDAIPNPANQTLLNVLNDIRTRIDNYLD
mgnify:CR=1 FL=1